jgi:pimeloyl-ACP methyl ester carboxylesterase
VRDLLEVLGVEHATVIGHSLGGGVAVQFAYQFPKSCERLVLVASGGVCADVTPLLRLASLPVAEFIFPILMSRLMRGLTRFVLRLAKRFNAAIGVDEEDLMRVVNALPDREARMAFLRTLRSVVDVRGQTVTMLDRIYMAGGYPVLVVWGARDTVIPAHHAEIAHSAMPSSRIEVFEASGHFPHRTETARFISVLEDFIKETEPAVHNPELWRGRLLVGPQDRRSLVDLSKVKCKRAVTCGAWCVDLPDCDAGDMLATKQQNDV